MHLNFFKSRIPSKCFLYSNSAWESFLGNCKKEKMPHSCIALDGFIDTSATTAAWKIKWWSSIIVLLASWSLPCLFIGSAYNQPILDVHKSRGNSLLTKYLSIQNTYTGQAFARNLNEKHFTASRLNMSYNSPVGPFCPNDHIKLSCFALSY